MGNGLNKTVINAHARLDKVLAVACYGRCTDSDPVTDKAVDFLELCGYYVKGLTLVGNIVLIKELSVGGYEHKLCGG